MATMEPALPIGDFARATHLSIKTLRHYHRIGLIEPATVDADTGYRYYAPEQIPTAQVIRRFRSVGMPLDEIGAIIGTPDVESRDRLIAAHLQRLRSELASTEAAVASLVDLLAAPTTDVPDIRHRAIPATPAAAISEVIDVADATAWWQGAVGELRAVLRAQGALADGAGGVFANELLLHERGRATVFVPVDRPVSEVGRVAQVVIPAIELATTVHEGSPAEIDRAYGALGAYVTRHAIGVAGALREYYLVGPAETDDESQWRTEVGWPIFITRK